MLQQWLQNGSKAEKRGRSTASDDSIKENNANAQSEMKGDGISKKVCLTKEFDASGSIELVKPLNESWKIPLQKEFTKPYILKVEAHEIV